MVTTLNNSTQINNSVIQSAGSGSVSTQETKPSEALQQNAKAADQLREQHLQFPSSSSEELTPQVSLNLDSEVSKKADQISQDIALGRKDKTVIKKENSSQIDLDPTQANIQIKEVSPKQDLSGAANPAQQADPAQGAPDAAPVAPKKPIQSADVNAIQEEAARKDDKTLSIQARLFNIMQDITNKYDIDPDSLEVVFDLNNDQGKFKLDTFLLSDQTCYKIDSTFTIKFKDRASPTTGSVTLNTSIFTNSTDPNKALAAAHFSASGWIRVALKVLNPSIPDPAGPPTYKNGLKDDPVFQTDKQALLNQKIFGIQFKRDSYGNLLTVDKLRSGNITLEFEPKKPSRPSNISNLDHIFANKAKDPIFEAPFSIHSEFVSSSYLKSMQEKLRAITDKSKEIKEKIESPYSGYNILKRKRKEKVASEKLQQLLTGLTAIDPKKSAASEKKKVEKDLENIKKREEKAKDIQDRIKNNQLKFGDWDFLRGLKVKYPDLEKEGRVSVIDGYLGELDKRIEDLNDFQDMVRENPEQVDDIQKELAAKNLLVKQANEIKERIKNGQVTTKDKVMLDRIKKDYPKLESQENQSVIAAHLLQLERRKIIQTERLSKENPLDKQVVKDVVNANRQLVNDYHSLQSMTNELIAYRSAIGSQNMSNATEKDAKEFAALNDDLTALIQQNLEVIQFFRKQIDDVAAFFNAKHQKSPNSNPNNPASGSSPAVNDSIDSNPASNSVNPVLVGLDPADVNPPNPNAVQSLPKRTEIKPLPDVNTPGDKIQIDYSLLNSQELNSQEEIRTSPLTFEQQYPGVNLVDDDEIDDDYDASNSETIDQNLADSDPVDTLDLDTLDL